MKHDWNKNILVFFISVLLSFLIAEVAIRYTIGHPLELSQANIRIMLYDAGENFINIGNIFKYYPNKLIRSEVYYIIDNKPELEYRYTLRTNNAGLIQNKNISPNQSYEILLGDSFTEGEGADPWFYELEQNYSTPERQLINGGILGTGPLQWEILKNHLHDNFSINFDRINVIFIGGDINRNIWNFSATQLNCLQNANCDSNLGDFYGFHFSDKSDNEINKSVSALYKKRNSFSLSQVLPILAIKSAFIYNVYTYMKQNIFSMSLRERNLSAIKNLLNSGKEQGFAVLITAKHETTITGEPKWDSSSLFAIKWLSEHGIEIHTCKLSMDDFHKHDSHPNSDGYRKIRQYVSSLIEKKDG